MKKSRPLLHKRSLLIDKGIQIPLMVYSMAMAAMGVLLATAFSVLWTTSTVLELPIWYIYSMMFLGAITSFLVMLFIGLYVTNKVAGPLYRLKQHMKSVSEQDKVEPLHIRESDFTTELLQTYNEMLKKISKI